MTLIAAFQCDCGVVLCGDSLEVRGDYKVTVDKVTPERIGAYDVAFGGSGISALIDGFVDRLRDEISKWDADHTAIRPRLNAVADDFYKTKAKLYPAAKGDNRKIGALICLRLATLPAAGPFLYAIRGNVVTTISTFDLVGYEAEPYIHIVKGHYVPGMPVIKAIMLGIHLMSVAKATNTWIGGDTQVVVATEAGMFTEDADVVREMETRLRGLNVKLDKLFLSVPDTTVTDADFTNEIGGLKSELVSLRQDAFSAAAARAITGDPGERPYQSLPIGSVFLLRPDGQMEISGGPEAFIRLVKSLALVTTMLFYDMAKEFHDSIVVANVDGRLATEDFQRLSASASKLFMEVINLGRAAQKVPDVEAASVLVAAVAAFRETADGLTGQLAGDTPVRSELETLKRAMHAADGWPKDWILKVSKGTSFAEIPIASKPDAQDDEFAARINRIYDRLRVSESASKISDSVSSPTPEAPAHTGLTTSGD